MKTITFGSSGISSSELGLGMAALGRPGYINLGHAEDLNHTYDVDILQAKACDMLSQAYDLGIRYIDVARSYGKAELFLSHWLAGQAHLTCGSKWGYRYTADWRTHADVHEVKDHSLSVLNRQIKESRTLLGDQLSIYHIHSATLDSGVLTNKAVLNRLWALREQGILIGLSLSGTGQAATLRQALSIRSAGNCLFGSVQLTYNILEQSLSAVAAQAFDAGLGVIVKEPLANGRLTTRNTSPAFAANRELLTTMANDYGVSIDALAIAFALQQPWSSIVLSGAATQAHLLSNVKACTITIDHADIQRLQQLSESVNAYWQTRASLPWN